MWPHKHISKCYELLYPRLNVSKISQMTNLLLHSLGQLTQGHCGTVNASCTADAHRWGWCHDCSLSAAAWAAFPLTQPLSIPKIQTHKTGEEDVPIHTCVSIHLGYNIFKFKVLPMGSLGSSAFSVQTIPVYDYCLLAHWFEFNQ